MTRVLDHIFAPFLFVILWFTKAVKSGSIATRAIALGVLFAMVQIAFGIMPAQAADTPVVVSDVSASTVSMLLGLLLPLIVALLTKYNVSSNVRIWVNLFLSAAAGAVGTLVASDGGFAWTTFLLSSISAFLSSALLYIGVYKPSGLAANVALLTANFGVGTPKPQEGVSYLSDSPDTLSDEVALDPSDVVEETAEVPEVPNG